MGDQRARGADKLERLVACACAAVAALDAALDASFTTGGSLDDGDVEARLLAWARAYAGFAADHRNAWRVLFEFRMREGSGDLPPWFASDQLRLFERLEGAVATLLPRAPPSVVRTRARTLFSAVHGIVALSLEAKLAETAVDDLDAEIVAFVRMVVDGLSRAGAGAR